ncbi:MAG TPA: hypothetical protein VGN82_12290 [Bosea sp. (in: a-proteobacteria)]|jgi:hypothetical protein|nr:hypothetical protein [Bosea sp. (in: a-proteobacteria)]
MTSSFLGAQRQLRICFMRIAFWIEFGLGGAFLRWEIVVAVRV